MTVDSECFEYSIFQKIGPDGGSSPIKVCDIEGAGRGLVATQDIAKGDVIFTALPAVVGPCARTSPQCVNCFLVLKNPSFCPRCGLMVCNKACSEDDNHQIECSLLTTLRKKLNREKSGDKLWKSLLPFISASVTTIRLLSLKWRDPPTWSLVNNLMVQHVNEDVWQMIKKAYDGVLHMDPRLKETDLRRTLGIQNTNGANLHFGEGYGRGVGVFPIQALLNHSCMCNTVTKEFQGDHKVEIRARFNIKAGEEITTSYVPPTQSTYCRRHCLYSTWQFWCSCARCKDPTECGSNLGGVVCPKSKCSGVVLSLDPLDNNSDWSCTTCHLSQNTEQALDNLQLAVEQINIVKTTNTNSLQFEDLLDRLTRLLCPTHHIIMELQQKLLNIYTIMGKEKITRPVRERKVQLATNILEHMDKIDPGNMEGRTRLNIQSILLQSRLEILTQDFRAGVCSRKRLEKLICEKQTLMIMTAALKS